MNITPIIMKDKELIYYDEVFVPKHVRIVSDMLCLDHTFPVGATRKCIGYDEIMLLAQSKLVDRLFVEFDESTAYVDIGGELANLPGWYEIDLKELDLKRIDEFHYY